MHTATVDASAAIRSKVRTGDLLRAELRKVSRVSVLACTRKGSVYVSVRGPDWLLELAALLAMLGPDARATFSAESDEGDRWWTLDEV